MPYSLLAFSEPAWFTVPPDGWVTRLREISPKTDKLGHLVFRYLAPRERQWEGFTLPAQDRGTWCLYYAVPRPLIDDERAGMFVRHWSELPVTEQAGRQALVSSWQHFMWHTQGVDCRPFWILQGQHGGTPAAYSERERMILRAENAVSEPLPPGFFPPCGFDERAARAIQAADRLHQAGGNLDRLAAMESNAAKRAEDSEAAKEFRRRYWANWLETMKPQAEYWQSYLRTKDADHTVPRATPEQAHAAAQFREVYVETGIVPGAGMPDVTTSYAAA